MKSSERMCWWRVIILGIVGQQKRFWGVTFAQRPLRCFTWKPDLFYILFPGSPGLDSLEADADSDFGVHAVDYDQHLWKEGRGNIFGQREILSVIFG